MKTALVVQKRIWNGFHRIMNNHNLSPLSPHLPRFYSFLILLILLALCYSLSLVLGSSIEFFMQALFSFQRQVSLWEFDPYLSFS